MNTLYKFKKILLLLLFVSISTMLVAQIPQQLNYQGALRDAKGFPIANRAISLRLSIQDNNAQNALVHYSEVRQVTTNAVGLYTIAMASSPGATQVSGNFSQINWAVGAKFLKVEIDVDGGANFSLAGISPLLSVPYALYAKYAENGPAGVQGPQGADGSTILSGAADPLPGQGNPGDYYFNTTTNEFFGPQNPDGTWPPGTVLLSGPPGPQGPIGLTGPIGPAGADGAIGPQGPIGLTGATGPAGPIGIQGGAGPTGPAGADGAIGSQGPIGLTGPAGADGAIGPQGPIGLIGPAGADGAIGPQGPAGPIGLTGPAGTIGALTDGHILVGDATNVPQDVAMSGDASIDNTGQLLINNGAVTLAKMAVGAPSQVYVTDNAGNPTLSSFNSLGWALTGNTGTVDGTHFIGTSDNQPINFRVNNIKAGRISPDIPASLSRGETTLGVGAGAAGTGLIRNTLIGLRAGEALNTNSHRNTLIGALAGFQMSFSANSNVGIGELAFLDFLSGAFNTSIGGASGVLMTSGNQNVFIGYGSGLTASGTGTGLMLMGNSAKASPNLSNATALGNSAIVTASNSLVLGGVGSTSVNVGIGTSAPTQKLHVVDGHIRSEQTIPPVVNLLVANGLTSVGLAPNASDIRGNIILRGTTADIITYSKVEFIYTYTATNPPIVTITPANKDAANCIYFVEQTASGFILNFVGATSTVTSPQFNYMIIE